MTASEDLRDRLIYHAPAPMVDKFARLVRQETVEAIKDRLLNTAPHDACDGSHQFCDPEAMPPGPIVWALLDEVAA